MDVSWSFVYRHNGFRPITFVLVGQFFSNSNTMVLPTWYSNPTSDELRSKYLIILNYYNFIWAEQKKIVFSFII
jgi:hypothetical protein